MAQTNGNARPSAGNAAVGGKPLGERVVRYREKGNFDYMFFALVVLIVLVGTVMVFSSSYTYSRQRYDDSYFYARKQLIWAVAGIAIMYIVSKIDASILRRFALPIMIVCLLMLVYVIVAPIGWVSDNNGARRWIKLPGASFQPSEAFKFAVILFFADYIPKKRDRIISTDNRTSFIYGVVPYGIVLVLGAGLLALQPHLSGFIIVALLVFVMMFLGGTKWRYFVILGIIAALGVLALAFLLPHARQRLDIWFDPFSYMDGKGWQPAQSLYAISAGGMFGVGLGNSNQKQLYLPEPQNDYIFPIYCEEFGFVGAVAVIVLYVLIIYRGIMIAMKAVDRFSRLLALGIILQVALQALLNLFVVTNMLPSTGISLPFFSYGGTSMLILLGEMGIILNISRYSLVEKRQPKKPVAAPAARARRQGDSTSKGE